MGETSQSVTVVLPAVDGPVGKWYWDLFFFSSSQLFLEVTKRRTDLSMTAEFFCAWSSMVVGLSLSLSLSLSLTHTLSHFLSHLSLAFLHYRYNHVFPVPVRGEQAKPSQAMSQEERKRARLARFNTPPGAPIRKSGPSIQLNRVTDKGQAVNRLFNRSTQLAGSSATISRNGLSAKARLGVAASQRAGASHFLLTSCPALGYCRFALSPSRSTFSFHSAPSSRSICSLRSTSSFRSAHLLRSLFVSLTLLTPRDNYRATALQDHSPTSGRFHFLKNISWYMSEKTNGEMVE